MYAFPAACANVKAKSRHIDRHQTQADTSIRPKFRQFEVGTIDSDHFRGGAAEANKGLAVAPSDAWSNSLPGVRLMIVPRSISGEMNSVGTRTPRRAKSNPVSGGFELFQLL
jgi:hypothetical protein